MLFHTWIFAIFMAIVLPVFLALRRTRFWVPWLMMASYFFYGWWNPYYLILILYSTTMDFVVVVLMDHSPLERRSFSAMARLTRLQFEDAVLKRAFLLSLAAMLASVSVAVAGPVTLRPTLLAGSVILFLMALGAFFGSRRTWLVVSLLNNLSILAFFKYASFVIGNLNEVLAWARVSLRLPEPATLMPFGAQYVLPVGISFFVFQSLSYTIDFYRGQVHRERNFIRFATFVSFFPQLVAGPIERARHLLPQFHQAPALRWKNVTDGLSLFLVGLFKKLALAGYLSLYVERVYDQPRSFDASTLLLATFAFAWQIFFDFSGYTDMARGVAKVMGFDLTLNFNNPYLASGLGDFWSRWHISLSTWFRDYVYIPLGGNRRGSLFTYRNLLLTFLISGVWHGAAWTFVIWGALHAFGILITRELERSTSYRERVPLPIKQLATFAFVGFAWIFFRAESLSDALWIASSLFAGAWHTPQMPALMLLLVGAVWLYQFAFESRLRPLLETGVVRVGSAVGMILYLCLFATEGGAFIYFQF